MRLRARQMPARCLDQQHRWLAVPLSKPSVGRQAEDPASLASRFRHVFRPSAGAGDKRRKSLAIPGSHGSGKCRRKSP